jgi:hypothetical protein
VSNKSGLLWNYFSSCLLEREIKAGMSATIGQLILTYFASSGTAHAKGERVVDSPLAPFILEF